MEGAAEEWWTEQAGGDGAKDGWKRSCRSWKKDHLMKTTCSFSFRLGLFFLSKLLLFRKLVTPAEGHVPKPLICFQNRVNPFSKKMDSRRTTAIHEQE